MTAVVSNSAPANMDSVPRVAYTAPELAEMMGISHDLVLAQIKSGAIKARKFGRIWIISQGEVDRLSA